MRSLLLPLLLVAACESPAPATAKPVRTEVASVASVGTSPGVPPAPAAGSGPSLELACARDADCAVSSFDVAGPSTCCPGCSWHPGSKASIAAFTSSCETTPPSSCPPIGCAMPVMVAKCAAARCVAVVIGS